MKIAYIHTGLFPSNSPSFTFAAMNAVGLAKFFDHCYFFIKKKSSTPSAEIFKQYFDIQPPANLSVLQIKNNSILKTNYFFFKNVYRELKKLSRANELDVVISRNVTFLPYLAKLKNKFGVPAIFESHDFFADLSVRTDINQKRRIRYEKIERKYVPQISGVICLQQAQKEWYQKVYPDQHIHVARTGIAEIHHHPFENRRYVTYIGSFQSHKGIEVLIQALGHSTSKPLLLIIGGKDQKEIATIQKLIHDFYDSSKVTITGWINKADLEQYLKQTALGILPLQDTFFNRYLTSPLKLFDFYAYGIPVIASDLPTTRELVLENETGLFFQPGDQVTLAQKIDVLLSNPEILKYMSEKVYEVAKHYLWENRAKQIWDMIENL